MKSNKILEKYFHEGSLSLWLSDLISSSRFREKWTKTFIYLTNTHLLYVTRTREGWAFPWMQKRQAIDGSLMHFV